MSSLQLVPAMSTTGRTFHRVVTMTTTLGSLFIVATKPLLQGSCGNQD